MNPLGLTDREILIVWAWATGHGSDWIADLYGWNRETVKSAVSTLLRKLGATNKTQATAMVLRAILDRPAPVAAKHPPRKVPLSRLIEGAHAAIRDGADPVLILSYLIWPPKALADRLAA